jgi:hypothetical protein
MGVANLGFIVTLCVAWLIRRHGGNKQWLQSTGDVPHARGTVPALVPLGKQTTLAELEWDTPDMPARVNVKNLTSIKGIVLGE